MVGLLVWHNGEQLILLFTYILMPQNMTMLHFFYLFYISNSVYFSHSTSILSFHINVVLTLSFAQFLYDWWWRDKNVMRGKRQSPSVKFMTKQGHRGSCQIRSVITLWESMGNLHRWLVMGMTALTKIWYKCGAAGDFRKLLPSSLFA